MKKAHRYFVYIIASWTRTLYIGVTNDLTRRIFVHRNKLVRGFTSKYNCTNLVYYEEYSDIRDAIAREKQIKSWRREKKVALIKKENSNWEDLSKDWFC